MTDSSGQTIGQYQIVDYVGRGESSLVYKGFQPSMNRYVAIKIMAPSLTRDPAAVKQFRFEAETLAQLQHPDILPIYDFGQDGARIYTISLFVDGGNLRSRLADYRDTHRALKLLRPITEALDYVHGRDLVHGNIRPENILLDQQGKPYLADFSFGSRQAALEAASPTDRIYFSPEQAQGAPAGAPSDVYALGVLLYEMCISHPPPVGAVPSPRRVRPELPAEVEKVILRAMAPFPEQRFQSAGEFADALERALQPATPPMRPPTTEPPAPAARPASTEPLSFPAPEPEERKVNPFVYALAGAFFLVLCLGLLFAIFRPTDEIELPSSVPGRPTLTATADLNVRSGPGTQYDALGLMRSGQQAEIIGRSPDQQWWVIPFPAAPGGQGWVSGIYSQAENVENIPIVQPPAPPSLVPTAVPPTALPPEPELPVAPTDTPVVEQPVAPTNTPMVEQPIAPTETAMVEQPIGPTEVPPESAPPGDSGIEICGVASLPLFVLGAILVWPKRRRFGRNRNSAVG